MLSKIAQNSWILLIVAVSLSNIPTARTQEPSDDPAADASFEDDLLSGKIIGGQEISISKTPYLVSVQYGAFGDFFMHICGGTLITPSVVITAGHCLVHVTEANQLRVRAGSTHQTSGGQLKTVAKYIRHPLYNASIYNYDIAILQLASRFWVAQPRNILEYVVQGLTWFLMPAAPRVIQLTTVLEEDLPDDAKFITAGWGTTYRGGLAVDQLYGLMMPHITRDVCASKYKPGRITPVMLCAGYLEGGKDTCQGDSGGPLIYKNTLYGVVSWGDGCAKADKPGVYAKITALRPFIDEHVNFDD